MKLSNGSRFKVSWLYGRTFGNGSLFIPLQDKSDKDKSKEKDKNAGVGKEREVKGFWFNNQRYQKEPTNQYRLAGYRSTTLRSLVDEYKLASDIFNLFAYCDSYEKL